ncbi:MAG: PIN domain-containing protein [Verrucomicrobiota bacterium]|nr:PIN domain-containing protein [Verrucomicrobiota bacterium]
MKGIADTGFLVAFANRRDRYFPWAYAIAETIHEPLLTCEAVLAETAFHLSDSGLILRMLDTGLIRLAFDTESHRPNLTALAQRYADRQPDLADLCLIRMSELHPELPVITVDSDFNIYRRHKREIIPLVMPPDLETKGITH